MLKQELRNETIQIANDWKIDACGLMAVIEVESGGRIFASVVGKKEPLIRFEGHYFYRLLGASKRNKAVVKGLADRRAGRIKNPRTQVGRWKLLNNARQIDGPIALQSTSWGVGQVMGSHWRWLEYASIDAMVTQARSGLGGQLDLMLRFIEKAGLADAMAEHDWRGFARGYNGPAYARNRYDQKLASAYKQYEGLNSGAPTKTVRSRNSALILRFGDCGDLVKDLQLSLQKNGFKIIADGDFGPVTRWTVEAFQRANRLLVDGIVGPNTFLMLERLA